MKNLMLVLAGMFVVFTLTFTACAQIPVVPTTTFPATTFPSSPEAFLGVWECTWNNFRPATLSLTYIRRENDQAIGTIGTYEWGASVLDTTPSSGKQDIWGKFSDKFKKLHVNFGSYATIVFTININGDRLDAVWIPGSSGGRIVYATCSK